MRNTYVTLKRVVEHQDRTAERQREQAIRVARAMAAQFPTEVIRAPRTYHGTPLDTLACTVRNTMRTLRSRRKPSAGADGYLELTYARRGLKVTVTGYRSEGGALIRELKRTIQSKREDRRALETEHRRYVAKIGQYVETVGRVHMTPGFWSKALLLVKARRAFEAKHPRTDAKHVGLELEFCSPRTRTEIGTALNEAGLADFVCLKGDGSVSPNQGDHGHEICILATQDTVRDLVPRVVAVLAAMGSYVNKSCGFHAHLDMRGRDPEHAWRNLRQAQPLLYRMVPKSRRDNHYCKQVRTTSYVTARRSGDRYRGINVESLRSHRTIEVRLHSATLETRKIVNWVELLTAIVDAPAIEKPIRSVLALRRATGISSWLASYVTARIAQFADASRGESENRAAA